MATSYFSRTPASAGNRKTYTISYWQKRSKISYNYDMMIGTAYSAGAGNSLQIFFDNTDKLIIQSGDGSWTLTTTQVFRDVAAWYHIVYAIDTTQATDSNRIKLYVNGSQVTSFSTATYMSQNLDTAWNNTIVQKVGDFGLNYLEGYMANVYNIDGTALTPSSFGETDATTGIWKPKGYSGSYGTNGFFLKFENSASLGTDSSGNGNNFTVNGTPTQTVDTPSNNFCTFNAVVAPYSAPTLSNGNTKVTNNSANWQGAKGTIGVSQGKWYWEGRFDSTTFSYNHGVIDESVNFSAINPMNATGYTGFYNTDGGEMKKDATDTTANYGTFGTNDIIGIALNMDSKQISIYKNGTIHVSNFALSTTSTLVFPCTVYYDGGVCSYNFGNGIFGTTAITSPVSDGAGLGKFQYTVPSGYYALCTKNINVYG
jgi:hypothetical protein